MTSPERETAEPAWLIASAGTNRRFPGALVSVPIPWGFSAGLVCRRNPLTAPVQGGGLVRRHKTATCPHGLAIDQTAEVRRFPGPAAFPKVVCPTER